MESVPSSCSQNEEDTSNKQKIPLEKERFKTHGSHISRRFAPVTHLPPIADACIEVLLSAKALPRMELIAI